MPHNCVICVPKAAGINIDELPSLEPGIHKGISDDVYFALPYLSKSRICEFKKSPEHYLKSFNEDEREISDALRFGSAFDAYLFDRERFDKEYYVSPPCETVLKTGINKGKKCGKQAKSRHAGIWCCGTHASGQADNVPLDRVITEEEFSLFKPMINSINAHPKAREIVNQTTSSQVVLIWDDPETGLRCKAKLDGFSMFNNGVIWDLKSCRDHRSFIFGRDAGEEGFDYYIQDAHYSSGMFELERAGSEDASMRDFIFIAVDKKLDKAIQRCGIGTYRARQDAAEAAILRRNKYMGILADMLAKEPEEVGDGVETPYWNPPEITEGIIEIY